VLHHSTINQDCGKEETLQSERREKVEAMCTGVADATPPPSWATVRKRKC
jgi:hypothetical protein